MMRSLYSGVAGLKTHQTKMDVIGNNIANVNTIGFKSSSVLFRDVLYQTTSTATGATASTGGTNASQIGLGTQVSSIATSVTDNGAAQSTNNPYDLMLNGEDFFIVSRGGVNNFTKVGNFSVDGAGCLVTSNGYQVMGWQVDPENPSEIKKDTVSALYPESEANKVSSPEQTTDAYMTGNIDATDPRLKTEEGVITTVSIYDSLGYNYTVKFKITENANVPGGYDVAVDSIRDENNVDISDRYKITVDGADPAATVMFDPDTGSFKGVKTEGNETFLLEITPINPDQDGDVFRDLTAANPDDQIPGITVDLSNLTMFSDTGECDVETHRGKDDDPSDGAGRTVGSLTDVTIDTQGRLYGVYDNGVSKLLGQIAVANFINPAGLEAIGGSLYKETRASGEFDGIGKDIASTGETMTQGVLEMSNVDLSQEFTDMIVTQRGFQANSRIITVSDTLIEELVNLKR